MKNAFIVFCVAFLALASACKSLSVSAGSKTKKYLSPGGTDGIHRSIGIRPFRSYDIFLNRLFNGFIASLEKRKDVKIVGNCTDAGCGSVDSIAEYELEAGYYYNSAASIFTAFPGNFIFMPSWKGMSYTLSIKGSSRLPTIRAA